MAHEYSADCSCELCAKMREEIGHAGHAHDGESCACGSHAHEDGHAHTGCAASDECGCGHDHVGVKAGGGVPKRLIVGIAMFVAAVVCQVALALPWWAELTIFLAAYLVLGWNVLLSAGRNIVRGKVFDENFLMTVATIGAFVLGDYLEGTAVMLFFLIGETLSDMAVAKSKKSITELMDIRPDYANIEVNGTLERVSPEKVKVGDSIVVKPFEKVPLDGVVTEGNSTLNTSALTGESMPRDVVRGSEVLAGSVNGSGMLTARVEKEYGQSTAAKILDIVENASGKKARAEKFITKFARYYTPIVCAAALVVAVVPSLVTGAWDVWVYRALLFLVISCPCALVVAVPLTYFGGIGGASKQGILVKGASYMDALARLNKVVFDKTGTLTKGTFKVSEIRPADGVDKSEVLAAAAAAESNSSHPIAKSVVEEYGKELDSAVSGYEDIPGYGVKARYEGRDVIAGSARLMEREGVAFVPANHPGTVLYVARGGDFIGSILIEDSLKEDARQAVEQLAAMGVQSAMLTGDNRATGEKVAQAAGIGEVYAELLPQDKVGELEKMAQARQGIAFVGDGINDAPVLARADVGIAMGGLGSDAAIEAADVVLMKDEPSKVPAAIGIAKKTKTIVWQNIVFALAVKSVVMVLGVMGFADMWWAVFADVGVTLLAVLNALRALKAPRAAQPAP